MLTVYGGLLFHRFPTHTSVHTLVHVKNGKRKGRTSDHLGIILSNRNGRREENDWQSNP